jgi:hypothetical protein
MTVRCCRTYEEVHEGDIGRVVKLDRDGLHDLNMQVDWQRKGGTYWVKINDHFILSGLHNMVCHYVYTSLLFTAGYFSLIFKRDFYQQ